MTGPGALAFLPWQQAQARAWLADQDRFAHAWLIQGGEGIGKRHFAYAAAARLLCEQPVTHQACGQCASCHWLRQEHHPDLRWIRPDALAQAEGGNVVGESAATEEGGRGKALSREIRIEQVRELEQWLHTATHRGGRRIVLLYPVEGLNAYAANALLKMLEEPPANTVFLLVSSRPDRVLPTLLSRCRRLPLARPATAQAREWLEAQQIVRANDFLAASGGAPLSARDLAQTHADPWPEWLVGWLEQMSRPGSAAGSASLVSALDKAGAAQWLPVLQRALHDIQRLQHGLPSRYYPGLEDAMRPLAERSRPIATAQALRELTQQQRWVNHPLNGKLLAQATLAKLAEIR